MNMCLSWHRVFWKSFLPLKVHFCSLSKDLEKASLLGLVIPTEYGVCGGTRKCQRNSRSAVFRWSEQEHLPIRQELLEWVSLSLWKCTAYFQSFICTSVSGRPLQRSASQILTTCPSCTQLTLSSAQKSHCGVCEFPFRYLCWQNASRQKDSVGLTQLFYRHLSSVQLFTKWG